MGLTEYKKKRRFKKTPEPGPEKKSSEFGNIFVVQKHRETQPFSVLTKRSLAEIAEDEGGDVKKAATGDPKKVPRRRDIKRRKKAAKKKVWHSKRKHS